MVLMFDKMLGRGRIKQGGGHKYTLGLDIKIRIRRSSQYLDVQPRVVV
jgi:hypothetical protein